MMTTVCLRSLPTKAWQAAQTEQFMLFQIRHRGLSAPKCFLLSFRACSGISGSASVRLQCSTLECACSVCTGYVFFGHTHTHVLCALAHTFCVRLHTRFVCACMHSFEFNCINVSTWRLQLWFFSIHNTLTHHTHTVHCAGILYCAFAHNLQCTFCTYNLVYNYIVCVGYCIIVNSIINFLKQ